MRTMLFVGTKRGYLTFKALANADADVVGVIVLQQDAHEVDRYDERISELAQGLGIPHYETKWLKDRDYAKLIASEFRPEIAFAVGCRILLPRRIYAIPLFGTLAVHDSLLPEYRGFAPMNWAILNGEVHTGVTLFCLSDDMDGGDIVAQKAIPIAPDETAPEVYERVCQATVEIILENYPKLMEPGFARREQEHSKASFTCSRTPADGAIDWTRPSASIYNRIRALTRPYPGAFTYLNGRRLYVWSADLVRDPPRCAGRIPGRVVRLLRDHSSVDVLTGDGMIRVKEVQLEGMPDAVPATELIRSVKLQLGLCPEDLLERIRELERSVLPDKHKNG